MIKIISELQALAQSGIAYSKNQFDIERYRRILEISAELLANNSNHKYRDVLELFNNDKGYATPKIDVRGAIFKHKKILLVREKLNNLWSMPGGWADINFSPAENILKEIKEETGYNCKILKFIGIFDKNKNNVTTKWPHVYKLFFLCKINSGEVIVPNNEIAELNFFSLNNLPNLSIGRVNQEQIEKCFAHYENINLPTEFD